VSETEGTQENIAAIRARIDNLEKITRLAVSANPNMQGYLESVLKGRKWSATVYLALSSGPLTQRQVAERIGRTTPTASRVLNYLHEQGLINRVSGKGEDLWMWSDLERTLTISRVAQKVDLESKSKN
jgi:DNA-binding HxlR family transcriptional regulator